MNPLLDELLQHACIFSRGPLDLPAKWRRAERIRVEHPELATASIHAAVVCGEVERVREFLRDDPSLATQRGGPQAWEPLLYACYGRMPNDRFAEHSVEIVHALLDAGASARTYFVHRDGDVRFTALTGVMGQGEMSAPEHPRAQELAELLLSRGADPNDSQGLYNTHLVGDDPKWLELLVRHGLGPRDPMNWHEHDADNAKADPIMSYLVAQAAANGHERRLRVLLEQGADANARSSYDGKTAYQAALVAGRADLAELLRQHGATPSGLSDRDAFVAACNAGYREHAERLLGAHPEYAAQPDALVEAAGRRRRDAVALMLELGLDPNRPGKHGHLALHMACEDPAIVDLLLAHGADPRARCFGGTATGWARHAGNYAMARTLAERSRDVLDAVTAGHVELLRELLREDPSRIDARSNEGATVLHVLPEDPAIARELVVLLRDHGADPTRVDHEGRDAVGFLREQGLDEIADLL